MKPVIDEVTGKAVPDPDDPKGRPQMRAEMTTKALMAMVLIALRREDKSKTIEDVREMSLDDVDFDLEQGVPSDDDPKEQQSEKSDSEQGVAE